MKFILVSLLMLLSTSVLGNVVVVVNKDSLITSLNDVQVANIFLARTNRFPNGEKSKPIELKQGRTRLHFYQNISGKTPKQLTAYWTTLVFSGKGRPPKSFTDYNKFLKTFSLESGAITYLELSQVTENMKIVYTFP
jgi:ABC-type phosphate transport system substrate-binding protein|tara:strand:- start:908 stop:1318 length:411 start_codon:yes stop_codon:yes gene_type:complete